MKKILYIMGFSLSFYNSIMVVLTKKVYVKYEVFNTGGYSIIIAIFIFFIGLLFLYLFILEIKLEKTTHHSICPKCKGTYLYKDLKDGKCPTCKVDTIDIDKYHNNKSNKGNL